MKILVFAPFYPPHIGGVENYIKEFNTHLTDKKMDIVVFVPHLPNKTLQEEIIDGVRIFRFPAWEIVRNYPCPQFWNIWFWSAYSKLSKEAPDIVISHTRFFLTSLLALIYAKHHHIPLVHIEHGSSLTQSTNPIISLCAWLYDQTLGKLVLRKATRVVAVSEAVKRFVIALSPTTECTVIYRGFDAATIDAISPAVIPYQQPILISIGRLISGKGIKDLIEALIPLKSKSWTLFIVGDGPERNTLETFSKQNNLDTKIIFLGQKDHQETMSLLKASDIFINPSHSEGLPTTVAEAALAGIAIIATDVGGTREIIEHNKTGLLVPAKDSIALSKAIDALIKDSTKRRYFVSNAYEKMHSFSWGHSIEKYMKVFNNISL